MELTRSAFRGVFVPRPVMIIMYNRRWWKTSRKGEEGVASRETRRRAWMKKK